MKNKKRFLAVALVGAMAITGIVIPGDALKAAEFANMTGTDEEEMEKAIAAGDGVELAELPDKDGTYIVYMETDVTDKVSIGDEVQEIAAEAPEVIVETDLTTEQVQELELLSRQYEELYIEENFFLEGGVC